MTREIDNRRRGCLLGLAVGDALGAAIEFEAPGTFEPVKGYRGGGPHRLKAGEWTDDTSMALALADSIKECGWDLRDQTLRYVEWWKTGKYSVNDVCFDIGNTTANALRRWCQTGVTCAGDPRPEASGNGSIMRLAPVPIRYCELLAGNRKDRCELMQLCIESSMTTHASAQCIAACGYLGIVLAGLMIGEKRGEVLSPSWPVLKELKAYIGLRRDAAYVWAVVNGSYIDKDNVRGSGYVTASLEAALWAFHNASDFERAVLRAVNLGDDADTTGAVCGQLAGAYWGEDGIPPEWLDGLARRDMIETALDGLIEKE